MKEKKTRNRQPRLKPPQVVFNEKMQDPDFRLWYESRPAKIKAMVQLYPYSIYKIKDGAPYSITCPGTIVTLEAYNAGGEVLVVVKAKDKLPQALEREKEICEVHGGDPEKAHSKDVAAHVNPIWLEPIE